MQSKYSSISITDNINRKMQKLLVLLHFMLETISTTGSPASMVYQFLQPFFAKGSLLFQEVKFNIYNKDDAGIHADRMEDLASIISKSV